MFGFSNPKTAPAPVTEKPAVTPKSNEPHPLDALTGGAFSAHTAGERAQRIRDWLVTTPSYEQMHEVFQELNGRDRGAAKPPGVQDLVTSVQRRVDESIAHQPSGDLVGVPHRCIAEHQRRQRETQSPDATANPPATHK